MSFEEDVWNDKFAAGQQANVRIHKPISDSSEPERPIKKKKKKRDEETMADLCDSESNPSILM